MTRHAAIVWLVLTLVLGAATLFVYAPSSPFSEVPAQSVSVPVIDTSASAITALHVQPPDKPWVKAWRDGATGRWWVLTQAADGVTAWPARLPSVHAALRIIAGATGTPAPDAEAHSAAMTTVTLTTLTGSARLELLPGSLAGRGIVKTGQTTLRTSSDLHRIFEAPGPLTWRQRALIEAEGARQPTRIALTTPTDHITCVQREGRWWLARDDDRSLVGVRADQAAIASLLRTFQTTKVHDHLDDDSLDDKALGLADQPTASIELDYPHPDETRTVRVDIGGSADLAASRLYARVSDPAAKAVVQQAAPDAAAEPAIVTIDAAPLAKIKLEPTQYIAGTTLDTPAVDVSHITIAAGKASVTASRTPSAWQIEPEAAMTPTEIEALLAILADDVGAPELLPPDASPSENAVTIELRDLADQLIAKLAIEPAEEAGSKSAGLAVTHGPVRRAYHSEKAQSVAQVLDRLAHRLRGQG